MNTLSLNTSTNQYSAAIMENETVLGEFTFPSQSTHFRYLIPAIDDLLNKVDIKLSQIDGFIIALGPGSFTGIRIGLAVIKGFTQGMSAKVIGISTLLAMANQLPYQTEDICPLVTSRKGEVFTALFHWDENQQLARIKQDTYVKIEDIGSIIENRTIFIGNDYHNQSLILKRQLEKVHLLAPANLWSLKASSVGILGVKKLQTGNIDDQKNLAPLYLRGADIHVSKRAV